jgi:hypothetical protein
MHMWVRPSIEQTRENATGVRAPPWTWPRDELAIEMVRKAVYSFATGATQTDLLTIGGKLGAAVDDRRRLKGFP